mmetsp:Transcript_20641/g.48977  ORF Transcript_20641/g.48977 Transcript_20641/m.48977 type:complete len:292 (+) Transcript_20641:1265-2140(+)
MQRVVSREGVVVLVVAANRRTQALRQLHGLLGRSREDHPGTVEDHRELGLGEELRGAAGRLLAAPRALQLYARGQRQLHHLRPVVSGDVDLRRRAAEQSLLDHAVQHLDDAGVVPHLLLVANAVLEHVHLLHLLKPTLAYGLVRCLRRDQQQRSMIPVGCLHGRQEVGDARPVLCDHHRHLPCCPCVAVCHHSSIALVCTVPEFDACFWEEVRDRHHGRADDAKGVLDAMHLESLHERFLRGHAHRGLPLSVHQLAGRAERPQPSSPTGQKEAGHILRGHGQNWRRSHRKC